MHGSRDAVEMARTMIARMGGAEVWRRTTWLHIVEEVYRASDSHTSRSETWRSLTGPRIWGRSQSPASEQTFASTPDGGWRLTDGTLAILTDFERLEWLGRWRRNLYVMYRRLAVDDPALRVTREGERRLVVYDALTAERLCWFDVNAVGEIVKWGAAFGSGSEEWVYGPLVQMGEVRMPAWGTRVDGSYRFRYISVTPAHNEPALSFDPPNR